MRDARTDSERSVNPHAARIGPDGHDPDARAGRPAPALLTTLAGVFSENLMGLLALIALATSLGQMVFDVSANTDRALDVVEWLLVGAFAVEFLVLGAIAPDRRAWMRSPWRIVDAATILGPVVALLPGVSDVASGSLMFRALRLGSRFGSALAFGTRAGSVATGSRRGAGFTIRAGTPEVHVITPVGDMQPVASEWRQFLSAGHQPSATWFHASNLDRDRFYDFARAEGVPERDLDSLFAAAGHAKLREGTRHPTLILQLPTVTDDGFPVVRRDFLLAVITDQGLLTAMTGSFDLQRNVMDLWPSVPAYPFSVRIACALLSMARERNQLIAQRFDDEARRLELMEGGSVFLNDTFRLRREISAAALDLWHIKAIVRALADGKATLPGADLKSEKYLDDLSAETESLFETVTKNKEELEGLIDLHINIKSFEMNKFLKLLAVVSFLGLIPSVAGGLLGMNVAGNPWSVTLEQVAFAVAMAMATALYVFAVKGWLR